MTYRVGSDNNQQVPQEGWTELNRTNMSNYSLKLSDSCLIDFMINQSSQPLQTREVTQVDSSFVSFENPNFFSELTQVFFDEAELFPFLEEQKELIEEHPIVVDYVDNPFPVSGSPLPSSSVISSERLLNHPSFMFMPEILKPHFKNKSAEFNNQALDVLDRITIIRKKKNIEDLKIILEFLFGISDLSSSELKTICNFSNITNFNNMLKNYGYNLIPTPQRCLKLIKTDVSQQETQTLQEPKRKYENLEVSTAKRAKRGDKTDLAMHSKFEAFPEIVRKCLLSEISTNTEITNAFEIFDLAKLESDKPKGKGAGKCIFNVIRIVDFCLNFGPVPNKQFQTLLNGNKSNVQSWIEKANERPGSEKIISQGKNKYAHYLIEGKDYTRTQHLFSREQSIALESKK